MRPPSEVGRLIRAAMGHVATWKRREVADTIATLRQAGRLSIREIADAVGRSPRHVKRVLADAGLSKGKAASTPRPPAPRVGGWMPAAAPLLNSVGVGLDPARGTTENFINQSPTKRLPCYASVHARHIEAGVAECYPAAPAIESRGGGFHDYEDSLAERRREDMERRRTVAEPAPVVAEPTHAEQRREALVVRPGDDVERVLDKVLQVTPPGIIVTAVEQADPSGDAWFPVTMSRARRLGAYTVTDGGISETCGQQRANPDGTPVAANGWTFPSLGALHITRRD